MAGPIMGRTRCPECGNDAAHVKKSVKGTIFRFCPEHDCGAQYIPRGQAALDRLLASMRPAKLDETAAPGAPGQGISVTHHGNSEPGGEADATSHVAVAVAAHSATATAPARRRLFG